MSKLLAVLSLVLLLVAPARSAAAPARVDGTVLFRYDGDTINVRLAMSREKVRLIGIDSPESRENDKAAADARRQKRDLAEILAQGKEAARHLGTMLPSGSKIQLEYDVQRRDKYGRVLAYVYTPKGEMVNERMLEEGYASPLTVPPNVRYVDRFREAYTRARTKKSGLWGKE